MCAKNIYNETIFLPKTRFSMRGNLPVEEPKTIDFWNKINLWEKIRKKFQDKPNNQRLRLIVEDIVKSGKIQKDDLTIVVVDSI